MKWSMDLNCALIEDIACTWLCNLKYSVLSQTSNVFYKPSQIKGLNCVLLHLFLQPLHSLRLCHKRMLHLPAWELLWTCYTRKRSSSWTLMLFIFERQYLSIFGNNLHLKDRKHDCLKVSGINALDVCLLNEKGRWLFSTTTSSLQMSWSQMHLCWKGVALYVMKTLWQLYRYSVHSMHYHTGAYVTCQKLQEGRGCSSEVSLPNAKFSIQTFTITNTFTITAYLFAWGHFATTQYTG